MTVKKLWRCVDRIAGDPVLSVRYLNALLDGAPYIAHLKYALALKVQQVRRLHVLMSDLRRMQLRQSNCRILDRSKNPRCANVIVNKPNAPPHVATLSDGAVAFAAVYLETGQAAPLAVAPEIRSTFAMVRPQTTRANGA